MKKDVGMAKHFSKKYGNKGWAFDYPVSVIWNQFLFCQDACQCLMLHQIVNSVTFCLFSLYLYLSLSTIPSFSSDQFFVLLR